MTDAVLTVVVWALATLLVAAGAGALVLMLRGAL